MKAKIKPGTPIFHDHWYLSWPWVSGGQQANPDTVFDVELGSSGFECRADGYGRRSWAGESGGYGSGAIHIFDRDGLIEVKP